MSTSRERFASLSRVRSHRSSIEPIKVGTGWLMRWHKAARCPRHVIQQVQIVPTPLLSSTSINRCRFRIRASENLSIARTSWWHDPCRPSASSVSEGSPNQSQPRVKRSRQSYCRGRRSSEMRSHPGPTEHIGSAWSTGIRQTEVGTLARPNCEIHFEPRIERLLDGSHLEVQLELPFDPCSHYRRRPIQR